jgi:polysaccharide chain length determinant protein (PEP-CTERM system associated)
MSVEFRQRKPAEYARILWRRKWMILLPTVAISFAIAAVVWRLPNVYQSTTLLIVRPSSLSEGIVPQLADSDLTIRINNIGQEVLSRTSLEPLIVNFNLYEAERRRNEPMESIVEQMRDDIRVELSTSRNDITNGFQLSFKGPTPVVAQKVASELAGKYVNAQVTQQSQGADSTKRFVEGQLQIAKDELDAVDKQRLSYLTANLANLPSNMGPLVQRLGGLYEQQKSYMSELGRLRDQRTALSTQLDVAQETASNAIEDIQKDFTDPRTTISWAELSKQESQLESEVQSMLSAGLRAKNPDVVSKQKELDAVKRQKERMLEEQEERVEQRKRVLANRVNPTLVNTQNSLKLISGEIARQEKMLAETGASIAEIEGRINKVPAAEVTLSAIEREYMTKKAAYDALLEKKSKADLGAAAASGGQADTIRLVDPASMPEKPVAPKRPLLMGLGLAIGLGVGLAFAAAREVPRLMTIQTVEDARHYTSLPVLVSVPDLVTPGEGRRRKVRRAALAFASLAATAVSIPALALLLKLTRVFEVLAI